MHSLGAIGNLVSHKCYQPRTDTSKHVMWEKQHVPNGCKPHGMRDPRYNRWWPEAMCYNFLIMLIVFGLSYRKWYMKPICFFLKSSHELGLPAALHCTFESIYMLAMFWWRLTKVIWKDAVEVLNWRFKLWLRKHVCKMPCTRLLKEDFLRCLELEV